MNTFSKSIAYLFLALAAIGPAQMAYAQTPSFSARELRPAVPAEQTVQAFLRQKTKRVLDAAVTYCDQSNAAAFAVYPRVFKEDVIPALKPFDREGELFAYTLKQVYGHLTVYPAPDTGRLADETVLKIIRSFRRADVAREVPLAQQGDIWQQSLYLTSFYVQIGDFAREIVEQKAVCKDNQKFRSLGRAQAAPCPPLASLDENVFLRRQADIEAFARAYSASANAFIRKTLAPLQTSSIPKADVRQYLKARLDREGFPAGLSYDGLFALLTDGIASPEQFYDMARRADPSFQDQYTSLFKLLSVSSKSAWADAGRALGMFEYISPGALIEKLGKYGTLPSHRQVLDALAASFAAEALEKRLSQIASDLFEFEKPFYYSYVSLGGAEEEIGKNWYACAVNDSFGADMIARLASDNLLHSGRRQYQDNRLARVLQNRRTRANAEVYAKILPFGADIAAGDLIFKLGAPLAKTAKAGVSSAREALERGLRLEAASSAKTAKTAGSAAVKTETSLLRNAEKTASVPQRRPYVRPAGQLSNKERRLLEARARLENVSSARRVHSTTDRLERAVWRLEDGNQNLQYILKVGTEEELQRTKWINKILKEDVQPLGLRHIEVEVPQVITDNLAALPEAMSGPLKTDITHAYAVVRDAGTRMQKPFVLSSVDVSGVTMETARSRSALQLLGNRPVSAREWKEIESLYRTLNGKNFFHEDLVSNLYLRRMPDGKLKVTLLDFEHLPHPVARRVDTEALSIFQKELQRFGLIEF